MSRRNKDENREEQRRRADGRRVEQKSTLEDGGVRRGKCEQTDKREWRAVF